MHLRLSVLISFALLFTCPEKTLAQSDEDDSSHVVMQDITVTSFRNESLKRTSLNISILDIDSLKRLGNFNITDLMARIPGVSMLSTGVGIAKPVIRGSYGNRVLILLNGLKFDNQQWQEEHGLGLGDLGIGRVEIVKGPMSVLFGSEALGGIINIIEEAKPEHGTSAADCSFKINSNTLGGIIQFGIKTNKGKSWSRFRAGIENNADYSDGNGNRVLNSRFDGYNIKYTFGFKRKRWESVNNYAGSFNRFGFIFNDIYTFVSPDNRWSRDLSINPNHQVLLNILSSQNTFSLRDKSVLNINAGIQSNKRAENEGGGQISLNMHLLTLQYLLKWDKKINGKHNLILSNLLSAEDNTNYGGRKIVPDARMYECNLGAYLESRINRSWVWENGISMGAKKIRTYFTPSVNSPDKLIHPFTRNWLYYNIFTGLSFLNKSGWNGKFNIASGVRIPNLAELSSNGLHEGVFTYEIGNPDFKPEKVYSANFYISRATSKFDFYFSPFFNQYNNYIYLAPTVETWFGFPVYRYKQQNARQYGGEFSVFYRINSKLQLGTTLSGMVSKTADGNYTPFIPANKITPQVNYHFAEKNHIRYRIYSSADIVSSQNMLANGEIGTKKYQLINAGISALIASKTTRFDLSLAGNNLLNQAYIDNLSRFKNFGLLNIGRNFVITCKMQWMGKTRSKN